MLVSTDPIPNANPLTYPPFVTSDADKVAYDVARAGGWEEWVRYRADLRAIEQGCYFNVKRAKKVRKFLESFVYIAPKKRFKLLDWQWRDVVGPIFGWCLPNSKRRISEYYCEVAKGNGKSFLCSALELYMLVGDGKYGAEVYAAAVDKTQAEQVFKESAKMISNSPFLRRRLRVINSTKRILVKGKAGVPIGFMRALSKESASSQGLKSHCTVLDELHVWRDRDLFGSLRYATKKEEVKEAGELGANTSLLLMITTAGSDRKSIGWDEHERARKFISGVIEDLTDYWAVIYAADENDDIQDPKTHQKANPSYGLCVNPEELKQAALRAKYSRSDDIIFRRYRMNQWVSGDLNGWINMDSWAKCKPRANFKDLLGKECFAGFDIASVYDLTAFVLVFPDGAGGYDVLCWFWCPQDGVVRRTQRENVPYQQWVKAGLIETTPGDVADYDFIRARINEIGQQFNIRELAIDRNFQGQSITNDLIKDGFNVVIFGQTYQDMSPASKQLEILVGKGNLKHGDNPVLRWMASNTVADIDTTSDAVKPNKKKSTEKIDGIIASIMAIGRASVAPPPPDTTIGMTWAP